MGVRWRGAVNHVARVGEPGGTQIEPHVASAGMESAQLRAAQQAQGNLMNRGKRPCGPLVEVCPFVGNAVERSFGASQIWLE